jgi:hypothetical protein
MRSWGEPIYGPATTFLSLVQEAIVQAVLATLPELDFDG